ncbi:hypothetical protein [Absidia glauca]|uniref:Uncharacterized protein n=1 Tax=Absidia glauca TaxID=4829 RepID=A0A168LS99_ABSGL|nr:hypothetical protein [Absidia glauca]
MFLGILNEDHLGQDVSTGEDVVPGPIDPIFKDLTSTASQTYQMYTTDLQEGDHVVGYGLKIIKVGITNSNAENTISVKEDASAK